MASEYTYDNICEELKKKHCLECLIDTKEDFIKAKEVQKLSPLYVKLHYKCNKCGNIKLRSLAAIKASNKPWLCKSCSSKSSADRLRKNYYECIQRLIEIGFTPLFDPKDIATVRQRVDCLGSCGHIVTSTLDALLRSKTGKCLHCGLIEANGGENNYHWKGGYDSEKIRFRKTFEFKSFVKAVLKRDDYTCQCCGKTSYQTKMVVHHKDGYNWCIEKRTDPDNGVTLCEECHKKFHHIYGVGNNTKEQYDEFIKQYSVLL